jgi:hypothetical protein
MVTFLSGLLAGGAIAGLSSYLGFKAGYTHAKALLEEDRRDF